jgi:PIN domain nuclease of toxin-antitoxin system
MKYLLDTVIFLWSQGAPERLNDRALHLLADGKQKIYLSAASSWEMGIKTALGKLHLPEPVASYIPKRLGLGGIRPLVITHFHALAVAQLPSYHQDPFDRMLIAQARSENMALMTADPVFSKYPVDTVWCGK